MENVILVIHLILALGLIGIVLLQRSEGGGLGIGGGGGGGGGVMSSRGAATALGKLTWVFAIAFLGTSITLTVIAAKNSADSSVVDTLGIEAPAVDGAASPDAPVTPDVSDLLPPSSADDSLTPPRAD
ncbi:protein translocase subunit secG [Aliiroseovarius sediminilitoris]|uniref:Protein-export membrane protein SecG n=1 Tax=Aliiroseovarius sediminilitoris TaxID=1173584 RepID=A0A1I0P3B5_9RHOB|nr:preprotein translocase subunit SecG [Aliiroseovarius sediminilitoris]SEW08674.1 protein translocase subunit secG [Aliiroseovarius sediminilitoris]